MFFSVGINRYPVCDRWWWHMWTSHAGQLLGIFSRWPGSCCHSVGEWPRIGLHSSCKKTTLKGIQLTGAATNRDVMLWDGYRKAIEEALIMETASKRTEQLYEAYKWISWHMQRSRGKRQIWNSSDCGLSVWYCNWRLSQKNWDRT